MKLPDNSVGISDLLDHMECARRMSYKMRRHTGPGAQSDLRIPESGAFSGYGSCFHEMAALLEDGFSEDDAIKKAWARWGRRLDPEDLDLLREDLITYRHRDFPNTRTVAAEDDLRIPLFVHDGEQIYFRFKLDRLYERLDAPGVFVHVDYKSSKWPRSKAEVDADPQMWAYNLGIHEFYPEVEELEQVYDQLRFGTHTTRKGPPQREQIRDWLIVQTTALLEDEDWQPDGLLTPTYNQWCAYCPLMESCPVVGELTEYALTRIAALAPVQPKLKKDGTPGKQLERVPLDPDAIELYLAERERVKGALKVLSRFDEELAKLVKQMPSQRRADLGYEVHRGRATSFPSYAKEQLLDRLGRRRFLELANITKSGLESALADDEDLREWALSLAETTVGIEKVAKRRP